MNGQRQVPSTRLGVIAFPSGIALGAIGAIAADRAGLPWIFGFAGGALAATLTILALPSLPTRRAIVLLLGVGGLGALRHASYSGADRSVWLAVWAVGTLVALLLVDRAGVDAAPIAPGGREPPGPLGETVRASALIAIIAVLVAAAVVPLATERLGRHIWPGNDPTGLDVAQAPTSLRTSQSLDMTSRPRLTDKVVFTVDADRADFWRGETYDQWDGSTWTRSDESERADLARDEANNVEVPAPAYDVGATSGRDFRQTFRVETGFSDVVFAAPSARLLETDKLVRGRPDGTLGVVGGPSGGFGKGAVYTVTSRRLIPTVAELRAADATPLPSEIRDRYAQTPTASTERVVNLAREIAAGKSTTYDKVNAIEAWLREHTQYSLNAPLSPKGVDVVDDFLFRSRRGWCEQIASSLVVLARSAGIPARLADGFAPGQRDALTGRFVVRERDAHAWTEIYFAGIGWQDVDPTAGVPLAHDPKPGQSWLSQIRHNAVPIVVATGVVVLLAMALPTITAAWRRRKARRATWNARTLHRLERLGRKAGRARAPAETPREYAEELARRLRRPELSSVGDTLDVDAFSSAGASDEDRNAADRVLTSLEP